MISLTCQKYLIAAIFIYVCGQLLIKIDTTHSPLVITCFLSFGMALTALILVGINLINSNSNSNSNSNKNINILQELSQTNIPILALVAGFLVFLGNYFWINAIKIGPSLGHIRMIMSGAEVALLLVASYFLFNEKTTVINFLGIALVLVGMYFIAN